MNMAKFISTVGGIGLIRPAPGTWGSLAALPFAFVLGRTFGSLGLLAASAGIFALGAWAAGIYENQSGSHDPSEVVIDEIVGQWIACVPLIYFGSKWWIWPIAFALFRLFDIWKPGPIGKLDKQFPGGVGTMIDDLAAGLCAGGILFFALKGDLI